MCQKMLHKSMRDRLLQIQQTPIKENQNIKQDASKALYAHGKLKPCRDPEFVKGIDRFILP